MVRPDYKFLSVRKEDYARAKRAYETIADTDMVWIDWVGSILMNAVDRYQFLKKKYPELKVEKIDKNEMIISDTKTGDLVKVSLVNGKIESSKKLEKKYVEFASLHPDLKLG